MESTALQALKQRFDALSQRTDEQGVEFWFARELMEPLGYARWENFLTAISRAVESYETTGYAATDHFRGVTKMIEIGKGGQRPVDDFMLTRYACYLIAQNGDPRKEPIAFAQSYFAVQTRKQELIEERMRMQARLDARERLRESEKTLSQNIYERGVDDAGFGRIRSRGDAALFTKTELLFVENIFRMLKKGGSACVIVPQGVLFGSAGAFKELRQLLIERCDLKAVITMPSGVFKPYAGVSTAILLFTKVWGRQDKVTQPATEQVWFYDMHADGYSLDDKRSKQEGYGDLQDIVARYRARNAEANTDRGAQSFMVPRADIKAEGYDLSLSRYKQDVFEEVAYEKPGVILDRLLAAELGEDFFKHEKHESHEKLREQVQGGIVRELMELKRMVG